MRYEWDPKKAEANQRDHDVNVADAVSVFEDDFALTQEDSDAEGANSASSPLVWTQPAYFWLWSTPIAGPTSFDSFLHGKQISLKGLIMKNIAAEPYRNIDFSRAKRGPVVKPEPGKTKISIRLDNTVLEYFRALVDHAGGGNYQSLINDALLAHIHQRSMLDAVRQVVKEELSTSSHKRGLTPGSRRTRLKRAA